MLGMCVDLFFLFEIFFGSIMALGALLPGFLKQMATATKLLQTTKKWLL
jgi:hypothetical protein